MRGASWKLGPVPAGLAAAVIVTAIGVGVAAASLPVAYCSAIPAVNVPKEGSRFGPPARAAPGRGSGAGLGCGGRGGG
jgi:hypothetical protein